MSGHLYKHELIKLANKIFPDSSILQQTATVRRIEEPIELLVRYTVVTIDDLYGDDSECEANLERIALSLDVGSQSLHSVVKALRIHRDIWYKH